MSFILKFCDIITVIFVSTCLHDSTNNLFENLDKKYYLVSEAYTVAKNLFNQGRANYDNIKNISLTTIDTFLDLVNIMNNEMAQDVRSAIVKFYKIKYFNDFTNYVISLEEMVDIAEHCLTGPVEKLQQIREQFHHVIKNFEDIRQFDTVDKCQKQLPDEVAASHCILHQAVLFNETMQENLITIVEIKTRQNAQDMNASIFEVQHCFSDFVPKFFEQLLLPSFTDKSDHLRVLNASVSDLMESKWKDNGTTFSEKWGPLVRLLKEKLARSPTKLLQDPLFLSLFEAHLSSQDILKTIY